MQVRLIKILPAKTNGDFYTNLVNPVDVGELADHPVAEAEESIGDEESFEKTISY